MAVAVTVVVATVSAVAVTVAVPTVLAAVTMAAAVAALVAAETAVAVTTVLVAMAAAATALVAVAMVAVATALAAAAMVATMVEDSGTRCSCQALRSRRHRWLHPTNTADLWSARGTRQCRGSAFEDCALATRPSCSRSRQATVGERARSIGSLCR